MTTDLRKRAVLEVAEYMYDEILGERVQITNLENAHAVLAQHVTDLWKCMYWRGVGNAKRQQAEALACAALTSIMALVDLGMIGSIPRKGGPADA